MNVRDMYAARMAPGAERFGPPRRISRDRWAIPGCPDSGPRLTLAGEGAVWVTWFSGNPAAIYASLAAPGGEDFGARETVQASGETVMGLGHPAVATLPDGRVVVAYECTRDGERRIEGRVRTAEGWSEPFRLGGHGEYPRFVSNSETIYLVYTMVDASSKTIAVEELGLAQ
jgi:hypothetical protein